MYKGFVFKYIKLPYFEISVPNSSNNKILFFEKKSYLMIDINMCKTFYTILSRDKTPFIVFVVSSI